MYAGNGVVRMKQCKVKNCVRKQNGKGYCKMHYNRIFCGKPVIKLCRDCKKNIEKLYGRWICNKCKRIKLRERWKIGYEKLKNKYVHIPSLTCRKGARHRVYTNGVTEEMKLLVPLITKDVLDDCIKNPRKYLDDKKNEKI